MKVKKLSNSDMIDELLQPLITENRIPGLSISVSRKNKIVFEKGYGFSNLENKTPVYPQKSIFRVASVSKPIAATALAIMVQENLIDLDASFYDYVPYYPKKGYDFTIRQLASHTAGMRGYRGKEYGLNLPYTIKDSITIFKDDDLLFKPGKGYYYNSYDWVMISLAIQEASGVPFEKYVQEKVLKPLKMLDTFPELEGKTIVNSVEFYSKKRKGFRVAMPVNNFYKLAGGGYLSTTADILKLGNAYLTNDFLTEKVQKEFLTAQKVNNESTYYGLGWQVSTDKNGNAYYGHIGNSIGAYSNFFVYPKEELVISILTNCTNPSIQDVLDEVVELFLDKN